METTVSFKKSKKKLDFNKKIYSTNNLISNLRIQTSLLNIIALTELFCIILVREAPSRRVLVFHIISVNAFAKRMDMSLCSGVFLNGP